MSIHAGVLALEGSDIPDQRYKIAGAAVSQGEVLVQHYGVASECA